MVGPVVSEYEFVDLFLLYLFLLGAEVFFWDQVKFTNKLLPSLLQSSPFSPGAVLAFRRKGAAQGYLSWPGGVFIHWSGTDLICFRFWWALSWHLRRWGGCVCVCD